MNSDGKLFHVLIPIFLSLCNPLFFLSLSLNLSLSLARFMSVPLSLYRCSLFYVCSNGCDGCHGSILQVQKFLDKNFDSVRQDVLDLFIQSKNRVRNTHIHTHTRTRTCTHAHTHTHTRTRTSSPSNLLVLINCLVIISLYKSTTASSYIMKVSSFIV